jgi:acetyl-CoA synthetase
MVQQRHIVRIQPPGQSEQHSHPANRKEEHPDRQRAQDRLMRAAANSQLRKRKQKQSGYRLHPARKPRLSAAAGVRAKAHIKSLEEYEALYKQSIEDPEAFWAGAAKELHWFKPWDKVLDWNLPWAKWFVGGKINLSYNCVDRHALGARATRPRSSGRASRARSAASPTPSCTSKCRSSPTRSKSLGIKKGDRVAVYMGMTPELAIACWPARASAPCTRSSSADSPPTPSPTASTTRLRRHPHPGHELPPRRRDQAQAHRRRSPERLPHREARRRLPSAPARPSHGRRPRPLVARSGGRSASARLPRRAAGLRRPALHPLHLRHHRQAQGPGPHHRRLRGADLPHHQIRLRPARRRRLLVHRRHRLGHRPLLRRLRPAAKRRHRADVRGRAQLARLFDRFWKIIDDHKVTIFYTAPTAIRAFIKWGDQHVEKHKLDSLRLLGTVGEPINPEAWMWYREKIGHNRCPIVDTWWQTETGAILIAPIPGAVPTKPGSATRPFFGIQPEVVTKEGEPVPPAAAACWSSASPGPRWPAPSTATPSAIRRPTGPTSPAATSPATARAGRRRLLLAHGPRRRRDQRERPPPRHHGSRVGAGGPPQGRRSRRRRPPDELKGQAISAFRLAESGNEPSEELKDELRKWVSKEIGSLARPDDIRFTEALPKTRSGKIMRRLLRELATHGEIKGDTTTLEDFTVIAKLRDTQAHRLCSDSIGRRKNARRFASACASQVVLATARQDGR